MQLTRFDRWLRESFVHETHVYTMRPVEDLPSGLRHEELPDQPGRKFKHRYRAKKSRNADKLIRVLKQNGQMFTTRVVDRESWYVPYIAPKDNRSVTWLVITRICMAAGLFFLVGILIRLWEDPDMRANILDSFKILKG
ncbi:hypothetical protein [Luteolibacter sp. LG18]|uniref:hypothetical protein n=1 Tax=Luteolibacter sp. LG18 TaxID=2819286 RepID=UPI002B2DEFEC|nr:hypothetical protein llg_29470 [Luteolibacter sp. LG18]